MGRTACTEPQCLYKGALYLYMNAQCTVLFHIIHVYDLGSQLYKKYHTISRNEIVKELCYTMYLNCNTWRYG